MSLKGMGIGYIANLLECSTVNTHKQSERVYGTDGINFQWNAIVCHIETRTRPQAHSSVISGCSPTFIASHAHNCTYWCHAPPTRLTSSSSYPESESTDSLLRWVSIRRAHRHTYVLARGCNMWSDGGWLPLAHASASNVHLFKFARMRRAQFVAAVAICL